MPESRAGLARRDRFVRAILKMKKGDSTLMKAASVAV
jgi:hypothetical protein